MSFEDAKWREPVNWSLAKVMLLEAKDAEAVVKSTQKIVESLAAEDDDFAGVWATPRALMLSVKCNDPRFYRA